MTTKKDALFRELARLLSKYSLADWRAVLTTLRNGGEQLLSVRGFGGKPGGFRKAKKKTPLKRRRKSTKSLRKPSYGDRGDLGAGTRRDLAAVLRTLKVEQIQKIYTQFGGQGSLPSKKKSAIDVLLSLTNSHSEESLLSVLEEVWPNLKDRSNDYAKWFNMISGRKIDGNRVMVDNAIGGSGKVHAAMFDEPNTRATEELERDIRNLLLGGPFKLLYNPITNSSRAVTFLPNGSLGKGRTQSEASWRISQGRLELLDQAGSVYSRFTLAKDRQSLHHTNDPGIPSMGNQQLIRISAKR